jgi:hypothetical protein
MDQTPARHWERAKSKQARRLKHLASIPKQENGQAYKDKSGPSGKK